MINSYLKIVLPALPETLIMVLVSSLVGVIFGLPLGVLLYISKEGGLKENKRVYRFFDAFINVFRSLPFIVLMLVLVPLTVLLVGKRIGLKAAIVPLSVSAIPFIARLIEGDLSEVDKGIIEAARSMGSSVKDIIKLVIHEASPKLISSVTMTVISLVGQSAIVGTIGGGGLGDVALRYGYQRNELDILWMSCITIILIVQFVQFVGMNVSRSLDKN